VVAVERQISTSVQEILEHILDKGIVLDAWVRLTLVGVDLMPVDVRLVVASIETYLRYANRQWEASPVASAAVEERPVASDPAADAESLRVVREAFEALNGHDPDRYAALLDDEYVGETHRLPPPVRGPAAACEAMKAYLELLPDLHFTIEAAIAMGEDVLVSWLATGTPQGVYVGTAAGARTLHVPGCTVTRLSGSKIVHTWDYWDTPTCCR
jgi:predicted ester cyclase